MPSATAPMLPLPIAALLLVPTWGIFAPVGAQEASRRPAFGVVAGPVRTVQLRQSSPDSEPHSGFLVGAWAEASTPTPWLSVMAELAVVRRGGEYDRGPDQATAVVDVDYLSAAVLPSVRLGLGPVALGAFAGPAVDLHLRSQAAIPLQSLFTESATQVLAVVAGGGVGMGVGRASIRLEARIHEQLTSAWSGELDGLRHRSTEVVFRLGMRPRP